MENKKEKPSTFYLVIMLASTFIASALIFLDKPEKFSDGTFYSLIALFLAIAALAFFRVDKRKGEKEGRSS